jgi:hypothetical protein
VMFEKSLVILAAQLARSSLVVLGCLKHLPFFQIVRKGLLPLRPAQLAPLHAKFTFLK